MKTILTQVTLVKPILEFLYKNHVKTNNNNDTTYKVYMNKKTQRTYVRIYTIKDYDTLIKNLSISHKLDNDTLMRTTANNAFKDSLIMLIRPGRHTDTSGIIGYNIYFGVNQLNDRYEKIDTITANQFTFEYWDNNNWDNK